MKRREFLATTAGAAVASAMGGAAFAASHGKVKAGFIYVGPVGDLGWSYQHDVGRAEMAAALGDGVETVYVESVPEGADAERVLTQMALDGANIIFTTSFGYMDPTINVAAKFPDVKFEHCTGYKRADNVATYNARFYEGRAVIGHIAGKVTKTNTVGYIASFPIPEVVMGINAFTVAMQKVKPETEVKVVWVNSWYDPGKEGDAAKALIDQGADIICQHTDSPAPLQVAEERGVWGFGQASDMKAYAPKAQLTAILDDWSGYYVERVQAVIDGAWETHSIWWGLQEGMVKMAPYGEAVTAAAADAGDAVREGIIAGTQHPFDGPIENQAGEVVVAADENLSDEQLQKMDWYVKGVQA
jgi:simple sugar transport system substrate-binding protein